MRLATFEAAVGGRTLRGTRYAPDAAGHRYPTAVLCHGFGSNRIESGIFPALARALVERGFGVVTFDRAGHGESDGSFFDTTVSADVTDAVEVLRLVAGHDEVDADDLHLMGMSLGAVVASVVAAESDVPIRSLSMWSTAAAFADEIRGGTLQGKPVATIEERGYFDFYGTRLGPALVADAVGFDPYERARGFVGPVNLLHGTADFIPVSYAERYVEVYGQQARLTVVPDADHGWANVGHRDFAVAATAAFAASHAGVDDVRT